MGTFYQMSRRDLIQCHSGEGIRRSRNVNTVRTVQDAQVNFANQPYIHWNMNTTDNLLHVSELLECHYHQGVQILMCASEWLCITLRTNSKDTTLTDTRTPWWWHSRRIETWEGIVCLLYSHFSDRTVSPLNWIVPIWFTVILTPAWMDHEKL